MTRLDTASDVITEAHRLGVRLILDGENLRAKAKQNPPAEFIAALKAHKPEIIATLARLESPFVSPDALAELDAVDLVGRVELFFGGKIVAAEDGFAWAGRNAEPPSAVMAVLEARRDAVGKMLADRAEAVRRRRNEVVEWSADDWAAFYDERAAIRQHDGRHTREDAERLALIDCIYEWQRLNCPPPGDPVQCWHCGKAASADTLASLNCRGGVFWIHPSCVGEYNSTRKAAAIEALRAIMPAAFWVAGR